MRPTGLSADYRPLLIIGFCGGFTTFSTLSADLVNYLRSGELLTALAYLSLSLIGASYWLTSAFAGGAPSDSTLILRYV